MTIFNAYYDYCIALASMLDDDSLRGVLDYRNWLVLADLSFQAVCCNAVVWLG